MKEMFKPSTDEREGMIVVGILLLYVLVVSFVVFLYFLGRITLIVAAGVIVAVSLMYIPRFMIISKLRNKDKIKISDDAIFINGMELKFSDIKDFRVHEKKPVVVFVFNNNLIVYQEADFRILMKDGEVGFSAIGSEKIKLLTEFLDNIKE